MRQEPVAPERIWGAPAAALPEPLRDALAHSERQLIEGCGLPRGPRVDIHAHLGTDADGHHMDPGDLVADCDAAGVARAVCFPANNPGPDGDFRVANREVCAAAGPRIVAFCRVHPARDAAAVMDEAHQAGACGLKLHPVAQGFALDAQDTIAAVAHATDRGWPVLIHAGFGARALAGPLQRLVAAVSACRLILAHGARGDAQAVRRLAETHPNLWFDTSLATVPDLAELPAARVVFGADRPYGEHATGLQLVALAARLAGWSAADMQAVLWGNANALLGRERAAPSDGDTAAVRASCDEATRTQAVRLVAAMAAVEMALVRKDPVAGPLLAQARRAGEGTAAGEWLGHAAALSKGRDLAAAEAFHCRKVVQALCRAAAQQAQAWALS